MHGDARGCKALHLRLLEDEDGGGLLLVEQHRVVLPVAVGGGLKGEELSNGALATRHDAIGSTASKCSHSKQSHGKYTPRGALPREERWRLRCSEGNGGGVWEWRGSVGLPGNCRRDDSVMTK
eukprot:scaffold3000_cov45-Phaeocystis_antarctica.AAC.6